MIILHEIKKIWSLKVLAVIAVLCALWYFMFLEFSIKHYPNGHPSTEIADLMIEINEHFGRTVTAEQIEPFLAERQAALEDEANQFIQARPEYAAQGIYNYQDFEEWRQQDWDDLTEEFWALNDLFVHSKESDKLGFRIQAPAYVQESWDGVLLRLERELEWAANDRGRQRQRINEIIETGEYQGTMDGGAWSNTITYFCSLAILIALSTLLLISPLIAADRMRNVHHLQYTSKLGRRIMWKQLVAVLVSSALFTTVMLSVFGAIYSTTGVFRYWNHGLVSFHMGSPVTLFPITFGGYVLAMVAMVYALSLSVAMIAFVISRFSRNLITAAIKVIPVFIVLWFLYNRVLFISSLFTVWNWLYERTQFVGAEPVACGTLLVVMTLVAVWVLRREKCVDVA
jgi:hypothetical protein